jgi:hypothetical protein
VAQSLKIPTELTAIAHEQLKTAAQAYRVGRWFQVTTLIAGIAAMFAPRFAFFLAFAAFVCQLITMHFRHQGQQKQAVGDEIRRRALLLDALGPFDQAFDLAELLRRVGDDVRSRAVDRLTPDYFASHASCGLVRLRDHLRENSFWNRCLYHESAQRGLRFLASLLMSAALLFLVAIAVVPHSATVNLTRLFIGFIAFLIAYTLFTDVLTWRSASRAIEYLDRQLDAIKELPEKDLQTKALGGILAIFSEYTAATSKTPPIPDAVYDQHRVRLNKLWSERESGMNTPLL